MVVVVVESSVVVVVEGSVVELDSTVVLLGSEVCDVDEESGEVVVVGCGGVAVAYRGSMSSADQQDRLASHGLVPAL